MFTKFAHRALPAAVITTALVVTTAVAEPTARLQYEEVYEITSSADSVGGVPANGHHKAWPAIRVYTPPSNAYLEVMAPGGIRHTYREFPMFYSWEDTTDTFTLTPVAQPVSGDFWAEVSHAPGAAKVTPQLTMTRDADDWTWPAGQASKNFTVRITLTATQDFIDDNAQMKIYPHVSWSSVPGITCDAVTFRDDPADLFTSTSMDGSRIEKVYGDPKAMTAGTTYTVEFDMQCQRGNSSEAILFKPAFQINYRPATIHASGAIATQSTITARNGVSVTGHTSDMREFNAEIDNDTYGLQLTPYAAAVGAPAVENTLLLRKTITALTGDTFEEVGVSVNGSNLASGSVQTPTGATYRLAGYSDGNGINMSAETQNAALIADFTPGTYTMSVVGSDSTSQSYQFTVGSFQMPTESPSLVTAAFDTADTTPLIEWQPVTDPTVESIRMACYGQNDYHNGHSDDTSVTSWQVADSLNKDGYMLSVEFLSFLQVADSLGRDVYIDFGRSARSYFNVTAESGTAPEIVVEQPAGEEIADGGSSNFGAVTPGGTASLTYTVRNTGDDDLTGLTITKDGADAADFTITTDPVAPVAGGGSTTFTVEFSPSAFGAKTAALHIASNDTDENPYDINLTGQGSAEHQVSGDGFLGVVPQSSGTDQTDSGRLTAQAEGPAALIDGNTSTRSTTFRPSGTSGGPTAPYHGALYDYAGMRFETPETGIAEIQINPLVFGDGGWWISGTVDVQVTTAAVFSTTPLPAAPNPNGSDSRIVEISTVDDIWTSVPFTTDYPADASVSSAGSVVSNSTYSFFLTTPESNITAIRVIGSPAGNTSGSPNEGDLKFIGVSEISVFSVSAPPEIAVQQPPGTDFPDGSSRDFGIVAVDGMGELSFTITNDGVGDLTGLTTSIGGTDPGDFMVSAGPTAPVPPGNSTTFTVRFAPSTSGAKAASIQIISNDADESPFDINLTGRALSTADDTDGDGLNDLAEYRMQLLGFDWEVPQPDLVAVLLDNAVLGGLYSENDLRNVNVGTPLLEVNNGTVTLDLQLQGSDDMQIWDDIGNPLQWNDSAAGDRSFYRLMVQERCEPAP
jgi:hypothetical protein